MDPQHDHPGVVRRRRYPKRDVDRNYRRDNFVAMEYHVTVADVLAWLAENAPGIPLDQIIANYATLRWEDDATAEEITTYERQEVARAARTEEWEREQLAKLTEKYGPPV